jgi:hypothetical protein
MKTKILIIALSAAGCGWLAGLDLGSAQIPSWQLTSAPANAWTSVATSADGARLVAVGGHFIYTSTNYGSTWISNDAPATVSWTSVASSADGTKLVATGGGAVYTNSGTTWAFAFASLKSGPSYEQNISSVASSADGTRLVAASSFGDPVYSPKPLVYVSADSGASWANVTNSPSDGQGWLSVVSSTDGNKLAAAMMTGGIFTSINAGATWASNNVPPVFCLASSADGNELYGAGPLGLLVSTNAGGMWTPQFAALFITNRIACSTNGLVLFGLGNTNIFSSFNGGTTWTTNTALRTNWTAIAASKDGTRAAAAVSGGGVYTLNPPPLLITNSSGAVSLLWSTNYTPAIFGLAQNTNLASPNWIAVPNIPVINNALFVVTLPATNRQLFFRLQPP